VSRHMVSTATRTVELTQLREINDRLPGHVEQASLRAQDLGVAGVRVHASSVDLIAAHRAHLSPHLAARPFTVDPLRSDARLLHIVAAGSPSFPYIWGLFVGAGELRDRQDGALTPVQLHTDQLRRISAHLHLHHRWGL
jgi:hypothetical protein